MSRNIAQSPMSDPVSPNLNPMVDGMEGISAEGERVVGDGNNEMENIGSSSSNEPNMEMDEVMRDAKLLNLPPIPSMEEYHKHKVTHTPFKAWCPVCVRNQAQNPPHKRVQNERTFPSFHMDYMFMNPNVDEDQSNCPILVVKEKTIGGIWALPVVRKGINGGDKIASRLSKIFVDFGAPRIILKCDQEPAIKDLQKETRSQLNNEFHKMRQDAIDMSKNVNVEVILENSPVGESQSNGVAENAVKEIQNSVRKIKDQLEIHIADKISNDCKFGHG